MKECGGEAAFWNRLSWDLLIIPQRDATQLSQFTLRHRTPSKTQVILGRLGQPASWGAVKKRA